MIPIEIHKVPGGSETVDITVVDQPGSGGAHHLYTIGMFNTHSNPSDPFTAAYGFPARHTTILFQNGGAAKHGLNGVTHEALLAIIMHRLACFQAGPFASEHNAKALDHCEQALGHLQARTRERIARGVEGQQKL